jgi:hypothetical protein
MSKLQAKLFGLRIQNRIIDRIGTGVGSVAGLYLANKIDPYNPNSVPIGFIGGGLLGLITTGLYTDDREAKFIKNVVFGPYQEKIFTAIYDLYEAIEEICDHYKDYSYKKKMNAIFEKYEACFNIEEIKDEIQIPKIRNCYVSFLNELIGIMEGYIKEKRSMPEYVDLFKHTLIPEMRLISKYLKDTKVILDHVDELVRIIGNPID